uniref:Transmembrane protein n=1 Tax=Strongyloides venezuelensis TaxID=75913 RepID=A0A0K0FCS9_STRVS
MTSKVKGEHKQCRPTLRAHDSGVSSSESKDFSSEVNLSKNSSKRKIQEKKNQEIDVKNNNKIGYNFFKCYKVRLRKSPDIADILWVGCLLIMFFLFDFSHLTNCPMVEKTFLYTSIIIIITSIIFMGIYNVNLENKSSDEWKRKKIITKGSILFFIGAFLFCYSTWKVFSLFSIFFSYVAFMNICGFLNLITFNE